MEDETADTSPQSVHGHITSLAVLRTHRKMGIAKKMMEQAQNAMRDVYGSMFVSLHVRVSNRAALTLYQDTLGFEKHDVEKKYYADHEDAFEMRKYLQPKPVVTAAPTIAVNKETDRVRRKHK